MAQTQIMQEQRLLVEYLKRLRYSPETIQPHLSNLIPSSLIRQVRDQFYNPLVLEMALVVIYAIFTVSTSEIPTTERIRHWFRDLEQIGAESIEGYAMRSDLATIEDSLILKAPRNVTSKGLLHELFVGLYGTNFLRRIIPNFAYLFGGFNCSAPIIQPRSEIQAGRVIRRDEVRVVSYCEDNATTEVPYIIYENITPAISLSQYIETCTGEQFMILFRQVMLALRQAWISIGFVHNDLHHENVLVQRLPTNLAFPYLGPQGIEIVNTRDLVRIIDFGRSHITYRGKDYGFSGLEALGVYPNFPLPITDVYKLLCFSLDAMIRSNNLAAYQSAKQVIPYFIPELNLNAPDFDSRLRRLLDQEIKRVFYYLSLTNRGDQERFQAFIQRYQRGNIKGGNWPLRWLRAITFNYDDFLNYIRPLCQCTSITQKPIAPLAYCRSSCGNSLEILNSFFDQPLDQPPVPDDFFELYDLYTNRRSNPLFRQRLVEEFQERYQGARDDYLTDLLANVNLFQNAVTQINPNLSIQRELSTLVSIAGLYRRNFTLLADAVDHEKSITFMMQYGRYIAKLYDDTDLSDRIDRLSTQGEPYRQQVLAYLNQVIQDREWWLNVVRQPGMARGVEIHPDLVWLLQSFPTSLDTLLD